MRRLFLLRYNVDLGGYILVVAPAILEASVAVGR